MNAIKKVATGQPVSLVEVREMVATLDLPPKAQARFENWARRYEGDVRKKQRDRYAEDAEDVKRLRERIEREQAILTEAAEALKEGLSSGSLNVEDARRDLTRVFADLEKLRGEVKDLHKRDEESWAVVTKDPAEWQAENLRRFPSLRHSLPALTPDVFDPSAEG